jgi:hypothetical protein
VTDQVVQVGVAAVARVHHVVGVGPGRGSLAPRPHAALVANPERGTRRARRHPERAPDIDHCRIRAEQNATDAGVARETLHRRRRNRAGELEVAPGRPGHSHQRLDRCRELEVGVRTAPVGGEPMVQGVHGELDQSIGQPARAGPMVAGARACTERSEGDAQRGPADRIEQPANGDTTVLTAAQLEAPALDRVDVFVEHRRGIAGVTGVGAVEGEAADRLESGIT